MYQELSGPYNALYEVFEADLRLKSCTNEDVIPSFLSIIRRHYLESYVGIRLLHSHNSLKSQEVMAENFFIDDNGFALITSARPSAEIGKDYVPNSWILLATGFVPMEFSHKKLVASCDINPEKYPVFSLN